MDEFDIIATYFEPLAKDFPGSLNLTDDAALLACPQGSELVVTKDAISKGIHFLGTENPALIARKLLRMNLSDLAAKGATPLCYFLALLLPPDTDKAWFAQFAQGLQEDQKAFAIHLAGGDTTATQGGLSLSLTAIGTVPSGQMIARSGAKPGDMLYVSGTLGDSALGLKLLQHTLTGDYPTLEQRYLLPEPRLKLGERLRGIATACMDISDGLVQDAGHLCTASGVSAVIHRQLLPLSESARAVAASNDIWDSCLSGGDDYELLFTAGPEAGDVLEEISKQLNVRITAIGSIAPGNSVSVLGDGGKPLALAHKGYRHFT